MCAECRAAVSYSTCATAIVIPRSRSSGALSIDPKSRTATPLNFVCNTFVIAEVSVVFPWSMCPIVPTFTCGFVRSYFAFAIPSSSSLTLAVPRPGRGTAGHLGHDLLGQGGGDLFVARELHGVRGASLRQRAEVRRVAEHRGQRHGGPDDLRRAARLHRHDATPPGGGGAAHRPHVPLGRRDR